MKTFLFPKFCLIRKSNFCFLKFTADTLKTYALFILILAHSLLSAQEKIEVTLQIGHTGIIHGQAFSPDGSKIITGGHDGLIKLWDTETGKIIKSINGNGTPIRSVSFSPNGTQIVSGTDDKIITLWNLKTGNKEKEFVGHTVGIESIAFSPDGNYIISSAGAGGRNYGEIKLWSVDSGNEMRSFTGYSGSIRSVAFLSNNKQFLSAGDDTFIRLWDIESGNVIRIFQGHNYPVKSISVTQDDSLIVSGSGDYSNHGQIIVWDTHSGKPLRFYNEMNDKVSSVCFSPNKKVFISCVQSITKENHPVLYDIHSPNKLREFIGHKNFLSQVCFSPKENTILSSDDAGNVKLWDVDSGKEIRSFHGFNNSVHSVDISSDGSKIISGGGNLFSPKMNIWKTEGYSTTHNLIGHTNIISNVMFSPDGEKIYSGSWDGYIKLWNSSKGDELKSIKANKGEVTFDISPNGEYIISGGIYAGGRLDSLRYWEIESGKQLFSVLGTKTLISSLKFAPDGKTFLSGDWDGQVSLWNVANRSCEKTFSRDKATINSMAISHDGSKILVGKIKIELWDRFSGELIRLFEGHENSVNALSFSSDGKRFISGSTDQTIKIWDVETGQLIKTYSGHAERVTSVKFSENDKNIISGSTDGTIRIWDSEKGEELLKMSSFPNGEWVIMTPDGYFDASKNGGGLVPIVKGLDVFGIDQFALKYNRPDLILNRLGSQNRKLIDHFFSQYKKRLKKSGFSEAQISGELHIPKAKIIHKVQSNKFIELTCRFSDSKFNLKRYNVYVNDIPIFGVYGKMITGRSIEISEKIELNVGDNKIEFSCLNEKGAESYRALTNATFNGEPKRNLYLLAFGVSKYKNTTYNLAYADKDALDLEKVIQSMKGKGFENIYTKVLTNEQVTPAAIKASKDFVKNAKPDDTFILFIAGHGMHDKDAEATYYYLTSNADVNNLKATAADFETIEDLLQGIPPRNKLFLMDACESGEIDEDELETLQGFKTLEGLGIASRGFKSTTSQTTNNNQPSTKRSYLYQKDRYIYNDLVRRSGAIVFSSSKGGELSYERSDIENGLFTEYIMKALTTSEADKDKNGIVSTDELRQYVSEQVAKASGDLQHPTVDRDNIYQKFGFGVK